MVKEDKTILAKITIKKMMKINIINNKKKKHKTIKKAFNKNKNKFVNNLFMENVDFNKIALIYINTLIKGILFLKALN